MIKNFVLTILNICIAGLPILITWDSKIYFCYLGIICVFILMFSWNPFGEVIIVFVLHAKRVPSNSYMFYTLNQYLEYLVINKIMKEQCLAYYTDIKSTLCFPISRKRLIVPLNLESEIIKHGKQFLINFTSEEVYSSLLIFSRRLLLLSVVGYVITFRVMEVWEIIFAFAVKMIFALVMLLASGALFESSKEVGNAISFGSFLGDVALKINNIVNFIQVNIVNLIFKISMHNSIKYFK